MLIDISFSYLCLWILVNNAVFQHENVQ